MAFGVPFYVAMNRSDRRSALSTSVESWDRACLSDIVLTRIIHEPSATSVDTRLRQVASPVTPLTYYTSVPQGLTAPSARLASRLHAFAMNLHE